MIYTQCSKNKIGFFILKNEVTASERSVSKCHLNRERARRTNADKPWPSVLQCIGSVEYAAKAGIMILFGFTCPAEEVH